MRTGAVVALLTAACLVAGCANPRAGDRWLGRDKLAHFAVSGGIGAATAEHALRQGHPASEARARSMVWVVVVGAGKEAWDAGVKPRGFWSWKDMTWNLFGGLLGGLAVTAARD